MERSLNKVMLIGYLGRDPEMRYTAAGEPVTAFSVATERTWATGSGERQAAVDWFNAIAWHQLAELCNERLREGSWVYLEGRLQIRSWQGESGGTDNQVEIVATDVIPLDGPRWRQAGPEARPADQPGTADRDSGPGSPGGIG